MDGICICSCGRNICNVCREISDTIVPVRKSESDYGLCRHLSKVRGTVLYSTDIGQCVVTNGIQGMGFGVLPMMAGVAELIGRGVVAIKAAQYKSYVGVCMASPAAWVLAGGLLLVMYFAL